MEKNVMKNTKKTLWKWVLGACLLVAGVQSGWALNCGGKIYVKPPTGWTSVSIYNCGQFYTPTTQTSSGWYEIDPAVATKAGLCESTFRFSSEAGWNATWMTVESTSSTQNDGTNFDCTPYGASDIYIQENPSAAGKVVVGTAPPNAKYFYVMIPEDMEEWMSSVPMISMNGMPTGGKPLTADPDMCGWYYYVFFDEEITDNVILYRDDDTEGNDLLGKNGNWESGDATPIPLNSMFASHDSVFFVADDGELLAPTDDGFYFSKELVEAVEGACSYTMAAIIYDSDASLHPAFSCYSAGGEGCQNGVTTAKINVSQTAARAAVDACIGVTPGLVESYLDTMVSQSNRKPKLSAAGKTCFIEEKYFNMLFNYENGVNEKSCFDMPFARSADGKWEFDSDFYTSPGLTVKGGFYPVETTTDSVIKAADPTQTPVLAARHKRTAEGPIFYGPLLREYDPVEKMPKIDLLCNGPGWENGYDCKGKFNKGDETEMAFVKTYLGAAANDQVCVIGWSCQNDAPIGWTFYSGQSETTVASASAAGAQPRWTSKEGTAGRNQQFCFESHATFTYKPGLRFNFRGDDDIWVFIDSKLAVDLGGTHLAAPGYVDLDKFVGIHGTWVTGNSYPLDIFFCDRRTTMSNVRIKTNMFIRQKTAVDVTKSKAAGGGDSYGICFTKTGDGSCASAMDDAEQKEVKLCGNQLEGHATVSYTLVHGGKYTTDPTLVSIPASQMTEKKIYKGGIDLTDYYSPKVNVNKMKELSPGRYTLFVVIDGKTKKVASFRVSGDVDVLYGDAIAKDTNDAKIVDASYNGYTYGIQGEYKIVKKAMGGELVPIYITAVSEPESGNLLEVLPDDAIGMDYSLSYDNARMKVYADAAGTMELPSVSRKIGQSGVDTLYVTVPIENLTDYNNIFEVSVAGRPTPLKINFYLPRIMFVSAPDSTGQVVEGETDTNDDGTPLERWVGSAYDLYLAVLKPNDDGQTWAPCPDCALWVHMGAETSEGVNIYPDSVLFENGFATISIISEKEYRYDPLPAANQPATIVMEYNKIVKAKFFPIYFREPPVPAPRLADVFDVRGAAAAVEHNIAAPYFNVNQEYLDGIGDSVAIYYHRPIHKDSLPTRVCILWDSSSAEKMSPVALGFSNIPSDTNLYCNELVNVSDKNINCADAAANNGYCSNLVVFDALKLSSGAKTVGIGKVTSYAEFMDKGKLYKQGFPGNLTDRIAPVPLRAEVRNILKKGDATNFDSLVVVMSEPVNMITTTAKRNALDYYLNSAVERSEASRYIAATTVDVMAESDPSGLESGRIKYMFNNTKLSPHVGDYVRLGGGLTNILWSDATDIAVMYSDLRNPKDGEYYWNSPTAYNETKRLPSPWVKVVGDINVKVITNSFAHNPGNGSGDPNAPAIQAYAFSTTKSFAEILDNVNGVTGHFVMSDMQGLFNSIDDMTDDQLNIIKNDLHNIYFSYDISYYTNLGTYVAGKSEKIYCDDATLFNGNCLKDGYDRNFFIAWNMRSDKGRAVGTGAYIVKFKSFVKMSIAGKLPKSKLEKTSVFGVKSSATPSLEYKTNNAAADE